MIRSLFLLVFSALLFACDTASNIKAPGQNYFLKYYGNEGNQMARDLIVNADGTFYILGNSTQTSTSITKVYIAKVDALGNVITQITYGTYSMDARDFELTSDGKLAVVANRQSPNIDVLLTRFSLDLKTRIDSAVVSMGLPNSFANSLTQLSDGGFIIEGYENTGSNTFQEMHFRVDNSLQNYANTVSSGWQNFNAVGTIAVGVKTIQQNSGIFYMFGYTNANFLGLAGTINERFWAYPIPNNGLQRGNSDDPSFLSAGGSSSDKIITNAIKVAAGGYLMVGIVNPSSNYSLKASITYSNDTAFNFQQTGVYKDSILLGNLGAGATPYATAYSATLHNFILANTYNTSAGSSDIILLKVGNDLSSQWTNPDRSIRYVQFGGNGEDTAAAVAELPDGHIMVLGTMQLGNPPEQFKIVLMKLNASGQLQD
jgi:hypothetical protein